MINSIIGAKGEMGKNLLFPLLKQIGQVINVDHKSSSVKWKKAWEADVIWLSVPRDEIPKILQNVKLKPEQLVIDICSIKRNLHKTIIQTGAFHLSLHPLQGPLVPLYGQRWVIIKTQPDISRNKYAVQILKFLKNKKINFLEVESEDEHDFMIGIVLGIPELLTIILDSLIQGYAHDNKQKIPDVKRLISFSVPAFNSLYGFYIHSINSSADWLRSDLIVGAHGGFLKSAKKVLSSMNNLSTDTINKKIKKQRQFIKKLSANKRSRIRCWIEDWFVDSSQYF